MSKKMNRVYYKNLILEGVKVCRPYKARLEKNFKCHNLSICEVKVSKSFSALFQRSLIQIHIVEFWKKTFIYLFFFCYPKKWQFLTISAQNVPQSIWGWGWWERSLVELNQQCNCIIFYSWVCRIFIDKMMVCYKCLYCLNW